MIIYYGKQNCQNHNSTIKTIYLLENVLKFKMIARK